MESEVLENHQLYDKLSNISALGERKKPMFHNRLAEIPELERMAESAEHIDGNGFMIIPIAVLPAVANPSSFFELHQWAFRRAQEILKPSWMDRDVLGVWN